VCDPSEHEPRCGGAGVLVQHLTPWRDHRDPDYETREFDCPGCPECTLDEFLMSLPEAHA
jgi:hypothetical protein